MAVVTPLDEELQFCCVDKWCSNEPNHVQQRDLSQGRSHIEGVEGFSEFLHEPMCGISEVSLEELQSALRNVNPLAFEY